MFLKLIAKNIGALFCVDCFYILFFPVINFYYVLQNQQSATDWKILNLFLQYGQLEKLL